MNQLIVQFEQTHIFSFDGFPTGKEIKNKLFQEEGVPAELICLTSNDCSLLDDDLVNSDDTLIIRASLMSGLCGGKGGFGAQLRALAKQKAYRKTTDFGACRDLSGRRLRHVNDEILLQKWQEAKDKGEAFEPDGETPTGIDLWFLSAPSWAEGVKVDKRKIFMKPRMKTSMCIDWKRARENRPAPDGAPAHWGCPRGRRCEFAHGVEELRGDAQKALLDAKQQEKWDAINKKKDDYMGVLYRAHKEEEEVEDLVLAGLRAAKRAKLNALTGTSATTVEASEPEVGDADSSDVADVDGESEEEMSLDYFTALSGTVMVAKATTNNATSSTTSSSTASTSSVCPVITGTSAFATVVVDAVDLAPSTTTGSVYYYEVELQSDGLMQLGWVDSHFIANFHSAQAAVVKNTSTTTTSTSSGSKNNKEGSEDNESTENTVEADGVGDDAHSWGFDGYRQQKWHAGEGCAYGPQTGNIWQIGDTVGCYLELYSGSVCTSETSGDEKGSKDRKRKANDTVPSATIGSIQYTLNGVSYGKAFDVVAPVEGLSSLRFYPALSLENNESVLLNLGSKNFKYTPSSGYESANNKTSASVTGESGKKATPAKGKKGKAAVEDSKVSSVEIVSVWEALLHPSSAGESADSPAENTSTAAVSTADSCVPAPSTATATAAPTDVAEETHAPINLEDPLYSDIAALEDLGLVHLKQELQLRGMKTGGTLQERAKRLHSVRGVAVDKIDSKLLAKKA